MNDHIQVQQYLLKINESDGDGLITRQKVMHFMILKDEPPPFERLFIWMKNKLFITYVCGKGHKKSDILTLFELPVL